MSLSDLKELDPTMATALLKDEEKARAKIMRSIRNVKPMAVMDVAQLMSDG